MTRIIDFHTHAFPDSLAARAIGRLSEGANDYPPRHDGTISGLLESMDIAEIDASVVCNIATKPTQERPILDWSKEVRSDRIIPLLSLHPDGDPSTQGEILDEAASCKIRGIKLHCMYQGMVADGEACLRICAACADRGLLVLFHAGRDIRWPDSDVASPERLRNVRRRLPNLKMVVAHFGGWNVWDEVADILAGEDVYLDTSFTIGQIDEETWNTILKRHSHDKILFGTDSPWEDQKTDLDRLRRTVSPEDFEKFVSTNPVRLLG